MSNARSIVLAVMISLITTMIPQAQARLYTEYQDDRLSLVGEHLYAVDTLPWIYEAVGDWQYPASDYNAYHAYARSGLAGLMTVKNDTFDTWSDDDIWNLLQNAEPGWVGQCFFYAGLLLLRSGDTDYGHLLQSYSQLRAAVKDKSQVQWGDIAFKEGSSPHTMVVLWVANDGLWLGDANYQWDEKIRTHFMTWQQLGSYSIADLNTLLRVLGSR